MCIQLLSSDMYTYPNNLLSKVVITSTQKLQEGKQYFKVIGCMV